LSRRCGLPILRPPPEEWLENANGGVTLSCYTPDAVMAWRDRMRCWRVSPLLPPFVDKLPANKLSRLSVQAPALGQVIANLVSWARTRAERSASPERPTVWDGDETDSRARQHAASVAQSVAMGAVGLLSTTAKKAPHAARSALEHAARSLLWTLWVPLSDGSLCLARHVSFSVLEDDPVHQPRDRKAPPWLEPHRTALESLLSAGADNLTSRKPPAVRERGSPPTDNSLLAFVKAQCLEPALADVELHAYGGEDVHDGEKTGGKVSELDVLQTEPPPYAAGAVESGPGTDEVDASSQLDRQALEPPVYAHRLVLAMRSPYWERLLSGDWAESAGNHRLSHTLPAGVSPAVARRALAYMYFGDCEVARVGGRLRVDSAEAVAEVCALLHLSDVWNLDHLKSLCEVRLAACIEDVDDVTALLSHTDACDAPMLLRLCIHHVRLHLASCQKTEAWESLRPELQAMVLGNADAESLGVDG